MTPERHQRAYELFQQAWALAPAERDALLERACGRDRELADDVRALLAQSTGDFGSLATFGGGADADARERGLAPGTRLADRYRIERKLGEGGMGEVYLATQLNLDRRVAVKVLPFGEESTAATIERFKREALAVARLRHPNIVEVYDFGRSPGVGAFLVMEHLEGRSLAEELARRGPLAPDEAVAVMRPLCRAVQAAHDAGVVHRDLKPQNVFLEETPGGRRVKVLDFGVAKYRGGAAAEAGATTRRGIILGTPLYMAPEQGLGREVDGRADVYALGCILFELLTGAPPFVGANAVEVLVRKAREAAPSPGAGAALDEVVRGALEPDAGGRIASPAALGRALAAALAGESGAEATPPATATPAAAEATNLPRSLTSFVGREAQVAATLERLAASRLVTLVGPGGIGKTRLAVEAASRVVGEYAGGVWFVDLAGVSGPAGVASAAAHAAGLAEEPGTSAAEALRQAAATRRMALVLDNCEHVVEAAAELAADILKAGPGARVLATSREPLGVEGEALVRVEPLEVPGDGAGPADAEAVRLLVDRVRLVRPEFGRTSAQLEEAAALCRALEGIPLAIELAAGRARVMTVGEILARSGDRLRLLGDRGRKTADRHRTLRATLDWSHELLTDDERALLRRLSVFAGGFGLEAAERVCAGDGIDELAVLDLLSRLVDKSLVVAVESQGGMRFRLLETVRQYARERLAEAGEERALLAAHAAWYGGLAQEVLPAKPARREWLDRVEADWDNVRAAAGWVLEGARDAEAALRLVTPLRKYAIVRGRSDEVITLLESALALERGRLPEMRLLALDALASLCRSRHLERALRTADEHLELARRLGDRAAVTQGIQRKGGVLLSGGRYAESLPYFEEALELATEIGDAATSRLARCNLGTAAAATGDFERALPLLEGVVADCSDDNVYLAATCLDLLGELERQLGDLDGAQRRFELILKLAREHEVGDNIGDALVGLGQVACDRGDFAAARRHLGDAARQFVKTGEIAGLAGVLDAAALLAARAGDAALAVSCEAASSAWREANRTPRPPIVTAEHARVLGPARERLSADEHERARAEGAAAALEEALARALGG